MVCAHTQMHFHLRNLIGGAKNRKRKIKIDKQKMLGDISLRKIKTNLSENQDYWTERFLLIKIQDRPVYRRQEL